MALRPNQTLVAAWLLSVVWAIPGYPQSLSAADRLEVDAWFQRAAERTPRGQWGVVIGTMEGVVLWSVNPQLELIPASTAKVFTTGFTRARMGGGARITTRVVGDGGLDSATGLWQGSWAIELGGDPTLERSGRNGPKLRELARRLRERGVRQLQGPLTIVSRTGGAHSGFPSVWPAEFEGQLYAPPVGPVTLHENIVSLTFRPGQEVGSPPALVSAYPDGAARMVRIGATTVAGARKRLSLRADPDGGWTLLGRVGIDRRTAGISAVAHDPGRLLVSSWAAALERAGIRWVNPGGPVAGTRRHAPVLAQVESVPIDTMAIEVNRRSLNIGAELMLQYATGNQTAGPALLTQHIRQVVGPRARVRLVDGSGLSLMNRMSPLTQAIYLARYPRVPGQQRFPLLLPANGTGTLRRLRGAMARGTVHAKTGTLEHVAALAGYLGRQDGVLVISMMYNGPRAGVARAAEWELFRLLGAEGVDLGGALATQIGGAVAAGGED